MALPRKAWAGLSLGLSCLVLGCDRGPPTYAEDVAAILNQNCVACHRDEGVAPFSLDNFADARRRGERIREMVTERQMPPWLPRGQSSFQGDRTLSPSELSTLVQWIDAGSPRGEVELEPQPPRWPTGWALGQPDLVLTMADTFSVPADGADLFRNFVLPVPLSEAVWVRAVELRPGNPSVVHHATMRVDETPSSRIADAQDSLPGFDELFSSSMAHPPGGFFLGWTPGRIPSSNPEGMAWRLEPEMDFIVQLHLRPTGDEEKVASHVGLYFTDREPADVPIIVRLGGQTMDISPGDSSYVVEDELVLPVEVQAVGAYPHAHFLGKTMEAWAETPDGERIELISIPDWDFNWQDAYRYQEPFSIPAGSTLRMRYVFDNSGSNPLNPFTPPRRVVYGPTSADEMAEFWLQAVPARESDAAALSETLLRKDLTDRVARYEHLLSIDPNHADAHFGLGVIAQASGDTDEARRRYGLSTAADSRQYEARYNLALIEERAGNGDAAQALYREALDIFPDYPAALSNLGRLVASDDLTEAQQLLERAVELDPGYVEAINNLGSILRQRGRPADAEPLFREALRRDPAFPPAHFNLAFALIEQGRAEEGLPHLNQGLEGDPSNVQAALSVAWILATASDPAVRRPTIAVDLATQIRGQTGFQVNVVDVLAAAVAAAGDFERAVTLAEEALTEALVQGQLEVALEIQARITLYRTGSAYVQPSG